MSLSPSSRIIWVVFWTAPCIGLLVAKAGAGSPICFTLSDEPKPVAYPEHHSFGQDDAIVGEISPPSSLGRLPPIDLHETDSAIQLAICSPLNFQMPPDVALKHVHRLPFCSGMTYELNVLGRAFYSTDQRIQWSGQEATFGVEGILAGAVRHNNGGRQTSVEMQLFVNEPYDPNIYDAGVERRSYRHNFEIDAFEISQLFITARQNDFLFALGRFVTPFGRTYFPLYRNDLSDAPFIRSEVILWRETGLLVQYDPGPLVMTAAVTNGSTGLDTNSSKAFVARVAFETERFVMGASIKTQDGIGSEEKKYTKNHYGLDAMVRLGEFTVSGELVWDEYGFRRPFDPNDISWGRSIYYRDQFIGWKEAIRGVGWYFDMEYRLGDVSLMANYGQFHPQQIGVPNHDVINRRGILKLIYHYSQSLHLYVMYLRENDVTNAQEGRLRKGVAILLGAQFTL
jgi:hypothetical protein